MNKKKHIQKRNENKEETKKLTKIKKFVNSKEGKTLISMVGSLLFAGLVIGIFSSEDKTRSNGT